MYFVLPLGLIKIIVFSCLCIVICGELILNKTHIEYMYRTDLGPSDEIYSTPFFTPHEILENVLYHFIK